MFSPTAHNYEHLAEPGWWIRRIVIAAVLVSIPLFISKRPRTKPLLSPAPLNIQQPDTPITVQFVLKDDSLAAVGFTVSAIGIKTLEGTLVQVEWTVAGNATTATIEGNGKQMNAHGDTISVSVPQQHWSGVTIPVLLSWHNPNARAIVVD